jgi:hypothetical protein
MQLSFTANSLLGGAATGLLLGAGYGYLQAPPRDRSHDAQHFGLIGMTIGAFAGAFWANPNAAPQLTVASNP